MEPVRVVEQQPKEYQMWEFDEIVFIGDTPHNKLVGLIVSYLTFLFSASLKIVSLEKILLFKPELFSPQT
jgi:hypothetical protein